MTEQMQIEPTADPIAQALEAGEAALAERLCLKQLEMTPGDDGVQVLLALSRWRQGRHAEAVDIYARLAHEHPDSKLHWGNYATAAQKADDTAREEEALRGLTHMAPEDAEWWHQLGILHLRAGRSAEARDALLRAFAHDPDSVAIRVHAARACVACHDLRASGLMEPWRQWLPLDDTLQFEVAETLVQLGEAGDATGLLEELDTRSPGQMQVRMLLATMYERVNRLDDAHTLLEEVAAAENPEYHGAVRHLRAQLLLRARDYQGARELLEQLKAPDEAAQVAHWFALARACDKLGDAMAATQALSAGHAAQIEALRAVRPDLLEPAASRLPCQDDRVSAADYAKWPQLRAPDSSQSPVLIVGFPRSGTTLLEQMLDAHPQLQSMDERPFFNMLAGQLFRAGVEVPEDIARLDQRDCDELRKGYLIMACGKVPRRWDARLVDKNPLNMMWLPLIHRMFPHAKFIFAQRHPCDVILSCYMQNFTSPVLAIAGRTIESLARAYVAAMENWLYHVEVFKPDVFVSRYQDLVADTPAQTARIAAFLGLDDAAAMLNFAAHARSKGNIKTPSYTQVIEPINSRGLGRWQRYRDLLAPALPILQPILERWGYSTVDNDATAGG